jgi:hypothetical protein
VRLYCHCSGHLLLFMCQRLEDRGFKGPARPSIFSPMFNSYTEVDITPQQSLHLLCHSIVARSCNMQAVYVSSIRGDICEQAKELMLQS